MDADRSHHRGRISTLFAIAAACACLAAAAPASADSAPVWTAPIGVSPVGFLTQGAATVAANAEGDEMIAWLFGSQDVYYVRRSAGGEFGDPVYLAGEADHPHLSMNAHGDVLAMWAGGQKGARGALIPAS